MTWEVIPTPFPSGYRIFEHRTPENAQGDQLSQCAQVRDRGRRGFLKHGTFCAKIWTVLGKPELLVTPVVIKIGIGVGIHPWVSILKNMGALKLKEKEK